MSRRVAIVFPFPLESFHLGKDLFLIPEGCAGWASRSSCTAPRPDRDVDWPLPVHTAGRIGPPACRAVRRPRPVGRDRVLVPPLPATAGGRARRRAHRRGQGRHDRADRRAGAPTGDTHPCPVRSADACRTRSLARPLAGPDRAARRARRPRATGGAPACGRRRSSRPTRPATRSGRPWRVPGADHLAERLHVVGNPVGDVYTRAAVPAEREKLVVAVGRWDLAAKDAPLLAKALDRFLAERPDHRVVLVGHGGEGRFGAGVERVGHVSQNELALLLGRARIVVTSSRWESYSLSSHEGLAMGCTVVGPALQPLRDIVAAGDVRHDRDPPRRGRAGGRAQPRGSRLGGRSPRPARHRRVLAAATRDPSGRPPLRRPAGIEAATVSAMTLTARHDRAQRRCTAGGGRSAGGGCSAGAR